MKLITGMGMSVMNVKRLIKAANSVKMVKISKENAQIVKVE